VAGLIKFGAVRPGPQAEEYLGRLLDAGEALACSRGAACLHAGVSLARQPAYEYLRGRVSALTWWEYVCISPTNRAIIVRMTG
jgi:hypothetical protein